MFLASFFPRYINVYVSFPSTGKLLTSQFGEAYLRNRILSHPDVGQKWYPELYEKYSRQMLK